MGNDIMKTTSRWLLRALLSIVLLQAAAFLVPASGPTVVWWAAPAYPHTSVRTVVDYYHEERVEDPYWWLEDSNSKEVTEWVRRQNHFTRSVLHHLPGRERLKARLETLLDTGDLNAPQLAAGRYFYLKRSRGATQASLLMRKGASGSPITLIDPARVADDAALKWYFPSRDGSLVAYGVFTGGDEKTTVLRVKDVETSIIKDTIPSAYYSTVAWLPDGKGFYYTRHLDSGSFNNQRVFLHKVGSPTSQDEEVFGPSPGRNLSVYIAPGGRWLAIRNASSSGPTEIYLRDCRKGGKPVALVDVRMATKVKSVVPLDDAVYLLTTYDPATHSSPKERYHVLAVDPEKPSPKDWREVVSETPDVLTDIAGLGGKLVLDYIHDARSILKVVDLTAAKTTDLASLPDQGTVGLLDDSQLAGDCDELVFRFESFLTPAKLFRADLKAGAVKEAWEELKTDIDPKDYEVSQQTYQSKHQTPITMWLVHRKGVVRDSKLPTILWGYGGFGVALTPTFRPEEFLLLERGGVFALPNLRGGGEKGEAWHQAGTLGNKQVVFDDYFAAAQYLLDQKYTSPAHLAAQGRSNGGLLVGAAVTQHPEMFRAADCHVPLLDMLRYDRFAYGGWRLEYGYASNSVKDFKWLRAYSPYHRAQEEKSYPAVLLVTGSNDSNVVPAHARKMAARLQANTLSDRPILLLETSWGHGPGTPLPSLVEEFTDTFTFLLWQLAVKF
jgi:prolyl oligopeptidase